MRENRVEYSDDRSTGSARVKGDDSGLLRDVHGGETFVRGIGRQK